MNARALLLLLALLPVSACRVLAGTVINTNLPTDTFIVNINAQQDGAGSYNGDQSLWYSPYSTQGAASLLTLPVAAGTYSFTVINPADAAVKFPALTQAQLGMLYTAWTYNSPWVTDYFVFNVSAATDSTVPQLFDGSPDPTGFGDAASAYADAVANDYVGKIRAGPTGRNGTVLTKSYTFVAATTLVLVIPDNGLFDNAGGVSVVVAPASPPSPPAITSAANATVQAGSAFTYQITASNSPVSFGAIGLPTGLSVNGTTGLISGTPANVGTYPITLSAVNGDGTGTATLTLTVTAQPAVPAVVVASPPNNITVVAGTPVPLAASVSDPGGVLAQVQFSVNGVVVATAGSSGPFTTTATPPSAGAYVLAALATDTLGRTRASSVTVTAVASDPVNPPPTASLLTPVNSLNLTANAPFTLTATADSVATGLDHVNFYADGVLQASFDAEGNPTTSAQGAGAVLRREANVTPLSKLFTSTYASPVGVDKLVNLIVVAFDKLGHATVSSVSEFHATVTSDRAPLVAISNFGPKAAVPVGSSNPVEVAASDPDTGVSNPGARGPARQDAASDTILAKLAYYINGANVGQAFRPPFNFSFDPTVPGKYVLHVVATDGSGLSSISNPVIVDAVVPTVPTTPTVTAGSAGDGRAVEGGGNGKVTIRRTGDTINPLVVRYKISGAAMAGQDYKALPGTVTIPAGASQAKVKIKAINDLTHEGTRIVKVKLKAAADGSYVLGDPAVAKLRIIDNE